MTRENHTAANSDARKRAAERLAEVPTIEAVLEAHLPVFCSDGDYGEMQWVECSCEDEYYVDTDAGEIEHRAHLADAIRRVGAR